MHFHAIVEVFYCFTFAIGLPSDASDYNADEKSAVWACMQNKVVVDQGNSETRGKILAIWAALNQLSENKNNAMCVVLLRLMKTKISAYCFLFVNIGSSPDRSEQSFSGGIF